MTKQYIARQMWKIIARTIEYLALKFDQWRFR